jgi:hypothetical protein
MKKSILRGFSTFELIIALAILSLTLTAVVLVTLGIPNTLADGHEAEIGASIARALLQKEFLLGLASFSEVTSTPLSTEFISNTAFSSTLSVTTFPDTTTKHVESIVNWVNSRGIQKTVTLSGLITDFATTAKTSCSTVLSGDWQHPFVHTFTLSSEELLPKNTFRNTYPGQVVSVSSSTLAIGITDAVESTDPTVFFFTLASTTNPIYQGSFDNATSTKTGFSSLTLQETILYGANPHTANFSTCTQSASCSQLQIFDISNPSNALTLANFQLATNSPPFAQGSDGQAAGKSIFYANKYIYLGLQKTSSLTSSSTGDEFNILDVQNPKAPRWIGGYSVGRTINQIFVKDDYAYLATDDPYAELIILNVHDPAHITLVSTFNLPGNTSFGYGKTLSLTHTTLSLGRSYILNEPSFTMLTISSTSPPSVIGNEPQTATTTPRTITNILLRNFILFVLTNTSLELWSVINPAKPSLYATSVRLPGPKSTTSPGGMACKNNILYVVSSDSTRTGYVTIVTGS